MPSESRRKRTRDSERRDERDSRRTKKKKRHSDSRRDSKKDDLEISGAEDDERTSSRRRESSKREETSKSESSSAKGTNGKTNGESAPAAESASSASKKDTAQAEPRTEDKDAKKREPSRTPPPSPRSRYQGSPSPPRPVEPPRRPRQFVIEYKGRVPAHDPNRRIPGLLVKKKKKKKKKKAKAKSGSSVKSSNDTLPAADKAALIGSSDPKSIRQNALMGLNTLRNKYSNQDYHQSLASLEAKLLSQNTWQPASKEKTLTFDTRLVYKPAGPRRRKKTALQIVDQGTYVAEAIILRKEAEEKELSKKVEDNVKKESATKEELEASELVLKELPAVPLVEWWDRPMVERAEMGYESQILSTRVTSHVEHPEVVRPDRLKPVTVPLPFYLTKAERRKKRRQIRKHKHETLTDEIRLGLREAPEPKLNLENIVRVLGSQAIQDPTSAEAKARASMLKRKMEHELHNEKRRLSGKQKRDKKRAKLKEDTSKEVHVALYRVSDLSDGKKRYKVDINASQYNLTGRCIRIKGADVNMVVVEGGPKGIAKYNKLMMRRIRWGDDLMNASEANNAKYCSKVWQGVNRKRNFSEFQMKLFSSAEEARKDLDGSGAAHYWDQIETHGATETF